MPAPILISQTALKYEVEVQDQGCVEFSVPFAPGQRIVVFVIGESGDDFSDLTLAAQSSLDFWNNPLDEKDPLSCYPT